MCWRFILSDAKKIEAIIARLASEHEGEVIAAARALKRMAEVKGKKLWEFVVAAETLTRNSTWSPGGTASGSGGSGASGFGYASGFGFDWKSASERARRWAEQEEKRKREKEEREKEERVRRQKERDDDYENMVKKMKAEKERERRQEEEIKKRRAKHERDKKATDDLYEEMKRYNSGMSEDVFKAFYNLKQEWDGKPSNWAALRDELALAIGKKGSDHLSTWELEFLIDTFQMANISPTQRQKAEQILKKRFS